MVLSYPAVASAQGRSPVPAKLRPHVLYVCFSKGIPCLPHPYSAAHTRLGSLQRPANRPALHPHHVHDACRRPRYNHQWKPQSGPPSCGQHHLPPRSTPSFSAVPEHRSRAPHAPASPADIWDTADLRHPLQVPFTGHAPHATKPQNTLPLMQTSGTRRGRSGSTPCMPPTTTARTPASWCLT